MLTTGISCGACAGLSEIYFRRMPGIARITISLSKESITLFYKLGTELIRLRFGRSCNRWKSGS